VSKQTGWSVIVVALAAIALPACGGATKTVTKTKQATVTKTTQATVTKTTHAPVSNTTQAATSRTTQAPASTASSQNNKVISQAAQAPDNQAQLGAAAIRSILVSKLGLNDQESFNLNHHIAPGDNGGDCYVKLGADAVNFEYMSGNILRSPNGKDIVFVQSNTVTPLVQCLQAVQTALGW
jgi:hypothetical protein